MRNFNQIFNRMKSVGLAVPEYGITLRIPEAKQFLEAGLKAVLETQYKTLQWLPEYDAVAEWLGDSKGKSLFLYGNCGRGKSLIARYIVPAAMQEYYNRLFYVVDAVQFAQNIEEVTKRTLVVVDDIGTEDFTNDFGSKRMAFSELMDKAEKSEKLMVITTNLDVKQIREKYGDRTLDRIKSTCKCICFEGKSLRL